MTLARLMRHIDVRATRADDAEEVALMSPDVAAFGRPSRVA